MNQWALRISGCWWFVGRATVFLVDWFVLIVCGHKSILVSQANFALPFEVLSQFIKYGASSKKTEGE